MAILKKTLFDEKLESYGVFIEDTAPDSQYFKITELPDVFTGGKNAFLIQGSEELDADSIVKIQIRDAQGNIIYNEPGEGIPEYYEGTSKVVAVYIYPDTSFGPCTITILGELKEYNSNGLKVPVPENWKGVYNVRWQKQINVNPLLQNTTKIRFYRRPKVDVQEVIFPIYTINFNRATISGSVTGTALAPVDGDDFRFFKGDTLYELNSLVPKFSSSMEGENITINGLPSAYAPTIKEVINSTKALVNIPYYETSSGDTNSYQNVLSFTASPFTLSFDQSSTLTDSTVSSSFAKITLTDLETFSGDVNRVKVYASRLADIGNFTLLEDIKLESNEILLSNSFSGSINVRTGVLSSQNIIDSFWIYKQYGGATTYTKAIDNNLLMASVKLEDLNTPNTADTPQKLFYYSSSIDFTKNTEYQLSFNLLLSSSTYTPNKILVYGSGSSFVNSDDTLPLGKLIGEISTDRTFRRFDRQEFNFKPDSDGTGTIIFAVHQGNWQVSNIGLRASQETNFSPNEVSLNVTMPTIVNNDIYDFKFEFYDINNNYVPVLVEKIYTFEGGTGNAIQKSLSFSSDLNIFTFSGSGAPIGASTATLSVEKTGLSGSVVFYSAAFDANGNYLSPSLYAGGQYPGLLTNINQSSTLTTATLTAAAFTGSLTSTKVTRVVYTASCDGLSDKLNIYRIEEGGAGIDGANAVQYVIRPLNGTALKNSSGTLELQLSKIDGTSLIDLNAGNIKLVTGSNTIINVGGGVSAGSNGLPYNAVFNSTKISGSLLVKAYDFDTSKVVDSITIIDITDGIPAGVVNSSNGLTFVRQTNNGYFFSPETSKVTASFYSAAGVEVSESIAITASYSAGTDYFKYDMLVDNPNVGLIVRAADGTTLTSGVAKATRTISTQFTYSSLRVSETFNIMVDGASGSNGTNGANGAAAKTVNLNSPYYVIAYDKDGLNPTPSTLFPITASAINFTTPYFKFTGNVDSVEASYTAGSSSTEDSASFTPPSTYTSFGSPRSFRVGVAESSAPTVEVAYDTITIAAIKVGQTGNDGLSSQFYFIKPLSGSQIRNSQGTLELQAVWVSGSTTYDLKSGSVVLTSASVGTAVLRSGSGVTSGSNAVQFNAKLDANAISGSRIVYLYDTGSNKLYDTITLVDSSDGVAAGSIIADTLIFRRDPNTNTFSPTTASVTASFFGTNGTEYQEKYRVYPYYESLLDKMYFTLDSDNIQITASVDDGSGIKIASGFANRITTKDLNFRFTFIDPQTFDSASASETFYIISDGQDGDDAYTVILTNDSHTLPTTNTGTVTYTNSGTNILVYKGVTQLQGTLSANPGGGFYSASISSSTNITPGTLSVVGLGEVVADHNSMTADQASILYKINCEGTQSVVKLQTFSKANQGAASKTVNLNSPYYVISYDKDGLNPTPSALFPITASAINFVSPYFKFTGDVNSVDATYTAGSSSSEDSSSFTPPSTYFTTPKSFRVGVAEASAPTTEIAYDTITIAAVKPGSTGDTGGSTQFYFIKPISGSQIKNSQGTLELQAVWISGSTTYDLKSGSIVLTSASAATAVLKSGSGITSGSNAVQFNAKFDSTAISGSKIVYLYDTGSNRLYDTITLVDATDGVAAGSVIADTLIFRRDPNNNIFSPTTASVTASFFGTNGTEYQEKYRVYPYYESLLDKMYFTLDTDNTYITASVDDGSGIKIASGFANRITTKDLNFKFTFTDPQTARTASATETLYIISDGQDGDDAYTVILTNDSHTLPTTNTGTVTYTNSGTNISVYKGATQLQATTGTVTTGFYSASISSSTNITPGTLSVVGLNEVVSDHSSITANVASVLYKVVCEGTQSVVKLQTLSKANQGSDGAAGAAAKTVNLNSPYYIISYDKDGLNPTPSALFPITASSINFTSPYFKFTGNVDTVEGTYTAGSSSTEDSASFTPPVSYFTTPKTFRVGVAESSAPSTEIAYDTITIAAVKTGLTGETGGSTQYYYIKSVSGSQLRNSQGTLELQAVWVSGSTSYDLKSGSIVLTSASVATAVLRSGSGIISGSNSVQFNAIFNSGSITGSRVVYLYDTGSNRLYDTITLIDINDGLAGGSVIAPTFASRRDPLAGGLYQYTPSPLGFTASFFGTSGLEYKTRISAYPSWSAGDSRDKFYYTVDASTASITFTADDGNGVLYAGAGAANALPTKDINFTFTFTDPQTQDVIKTSETFYIISDGVDGDDAYTIVLTNESHTLPTTNTGTITYTSSGTNIIAYRGTTELNGVTSGTPIAGQFSASVSASNITAGAVTSPGNPIVVADHSAMNASVDITTITYTINLENSQSVTKVQTLTKAKQGTDGAAGATAKTVNLNSPYYVISYDKDGLNPSPTSLFPITASAINFTSPYFKFTGNVDTVEGTFTAGSSSTEDSASFTPPASYFTTPKTFRVGVAEASAPTVEVAYDTITIAAIKPGQVGNDGLPAQFYFIKPISGSQIKNSQGTLELQAVWVSGSTTYDLKSGSVVLTSGSAAGAVLRSGSGVTSGSNAVQFNAVFNSTAISGSRVVYLYDTGSNRLYDTITLVDATDGVTAGSVLSDSLVFRRDPNNNLYSPSTASVTASFFGTNGAEYQEKYRVYPYYESLLDKMYFTLDSDNTTITASIDDGGGNRIASGFANRIATKDLNFRFTFTDPQTAKSASATETFYIISDGQDGDDAYTVILTNDSHTLPTTNTGTVTYTNSGTNISVFKGATQLQATLTANPPTGFYSASISSSTNITPGALSVVGLNEVVGDHSSITSNQASILYKVVCEGTQSVVKLQTLSKANQGSDGATAKTVNLTSPYYIISYDKDGLNPTPSALFQITGSAINFTTPYFRFTGDVNSVEGTYTAGSSSTEDSASFTPPASYFTTPKSFRVGVSEAAAPSTEIAYDTITIAAVKAGNTGNTGNSTQFYFIRPLSGSQLINSQGTLELQAVWISGSTTYDLKSGSIVLTSASVGTSVLRSGSGITSGSNAVQFNAVFNSGSITGSRVVYLYDTGSNILYDSITLANISDGTAAGFVAANALFTRREPLAGGLYQYNPTSLPMTASFIGTSGTQYNTRITLYPSYSVARNIDSMYYTLDASTASITFTADDGNGNLYAGAGASNYKDTKDVTFKFTFTDPQTNDTAAALETFYIVSDGVDGDDAYTVVLTNDAHTAPTTNTGTITYTNSGTSIIAYKGGVELNGITSGIPIAGQFSASVSASNITAGTVTSPGNPIVIGDHSNMIADLASVTYTINLEGSGSFTKVQTISKARQGVDGQMNLAYVITPVSGTILKNKTGTLELRLTRLSGSAVNEISGGAVVLVTGSANTPISVGGGVTAGPNGVLWNAIFDTTKISGSLVVKARDTGSGVTYDTITLADITDGLTAGTINATNGLILTRNPNTLHTYNPSSTAFTASFYDIRGNLYTSSLLITPNYSYTLGDQLKYTINQTNTNMTLTVKDAAGNTLTNDTFANTTGINVRYVFVDPYSGDIVDCIETARIAVDGSKGFVLAADTSRNQFVYDPDNQFASATTNEYIDITLKTNLTSGSLLITSASNLPRLALISSTNISEFTQSVYRLFSSDTTKDYTALGGTNASSWSYYTPTSASHGGTYVFTQVGFSSSVYVEGVLKGDKSKNLDATSDTNQFYYKMTDASLNPSGQTISINVKRNNLGSTTNTITVTSGSGKPSLTVGSNNSSTGVQSYSLAGSSYAYSTGATTYTFTAQDLNSVTYTDSITVTPVIVESQVSFNVSNENTSLSAQSTGWVASGSFLLTSGSINVKVGTEDIVFASPISNNKFSASISQSSNVGSTGVITNNNYSIGVLTQDTGSLLLKIVYQDARGTQVSGSKIVTYSKSKAGVPNVVIAVSPSAQSINSNSRGSGSASPSTLTITALEGSTSRFTSIGTPTYTNGLAGSVSTNTIVFSSTATSMTSDTGTVTIPVNYTDSEGTTGTKNIVATVTRTRTAAPTTLAILSSEAQTAHSSSTAVPTPTNFTVTVNEGGSNYTYDAALSANNTFYISSITGGTNSTSTVTPTTPTTYSGTTVSLTISYKNSEGTTGTINKTHIVSVARQGVTGDTGATGADGKRTASGMVHYQISSSTAPSTPSATSYTFSTGLFGGLTANWAFGAPIYSGSNAAKYWYSTYTAVETTAGGGTATPSFGTPAQAIGFSGLVSFTSNTTTLKQIEDGVGPAISFGISGSTLINGSNISTGRIISNNYVTGSGNGFTNAGTILNLDANVFASPNFYIDALGNAVFNGSIRVGSTNYATSEVLNANIKVGGKNLILNSKPVVFNQIVGVTSNGATLTVDSASANLWNGQSTLSVSGSNGFYWNSEPIIEPNTEYIISMMVKGNSTITGGSSTPLHIQVPAGAHTYENLGAYDNDITTSWKQIWRKFSSTSSSNSTLRVYLYNIGSVPCNVAWVKLEKGNKETDWTAAPEDVLSGSVNNVDLLGGSVLNYNPDFSISTAEGKPAGAYAVRVTADISTINFLDANKNALKLKYPGNTECGVGMPAIRVNKDARYNISFRVKSNANYSTGFYFRMQEIDNELPQGYTHIAQYGGTNGTYSTGVREITNGAGLTIVSGTATENGPITNAYVTYDITYVPTVTAKWASPIFLNWTGMSGDELHIDRLAIQQDTSVKTQGSVGGWTINSSQIYAGTAGSDGAFNSSTGITMGSAGYISSKNFYISSSGDARFKGNITFGARGSGINIAPITMRPNPSGSAFGGVSGSSYEGLIYINGSSTENSLNYINDPFGKTSIGWECYPSGDSNADGGWESSYFEIDTTKTYKFIVYFKRYASATTSAGHTYWGTHGNDGSNEVALEAVGGGSYTNPYFWYGVPTELNKWYLIVGYVHGKNYTGTTSQGGVYDTVTGEKVTSFVYGNPVQDWKWTSGCTKTNHRAYLYYNTIANGITKYQDLWGPAVYEVDGNEPDLNKLLDKGKMLADGVFKGGTFIDNNTIFSPVIAGINGYFSGKVLVGLSSSVVIDGTNQKLYQGTGSFANSNTGFYLDSEGKFSLKDKLQFDGTNLIVSGSISATSGQFGGWSINSNGFYNGNVSFQSGINNYIQIIGDIGSSYAGNRVYIHSGSLSSLSSGTSVNATTPTSYTNIGSISTGYLGNSGTTVTIGTSGITMTSLSSTSTYNIRAKVQSKFTISYGSVVVTSSYDSSYTSNNINSAAGYISYYTKYSDPGGGTARTDLTKINAGWIANYTSEANDFMDRYNKTYGTSYSLSGNLSQMTMGQYLDIPVALSLVNGSATITQNVTYKGVAIGSANATVSPTSQTTTIELDPITFDFNSSGDGTNPLSATLSKSNTIESQYRMRRWTVGYFPAFTFMGQSMTAGYAVYASDPGSQTVATTITYEIRGYSLSATALTKQVEISEQGLQAVFNADTSSLTGNFFLISDVGTPSTSNFNIKTAGYFAHYGELHTKGNIVAYSTSLSSDKNLKDNISPITKKELTLLDLIDPVQYTWKDDKDNKIHYGFIAQDVQKVYPNMADKKIMGEYLTVNYIEFIPLMLAKINSLEKEINELKKQKE